MVDRKGAQKIYGQNLHYQVIIIIKNRRYLNMNLGFFLHACYSLLARVSEET